MKCTTFLVTLALILFKVISGQHNALVYNENFETNNSVPQQQPIITYAMVQELINQNANTAPKPASNINQHQLLMQTNAPATSPMQQIQLPPDLQQQTLQVQQNLQLKNPLQVQEAPFLQQNLQLQPQIQQQILPQIQPLLQTQNPIRMQFDTQQPLMPLQSQDFLQSQPQFQNQPQLQLPSLLESTQPLQPLQYPQPLYTQQPLQQTLQSLEPLQATQPLQQQQFQRNSPQKQLTVPEAKDVVDIPGAYQINNPNSQIQVKWQSSNSQAILNTDNLYNSQNALNMQPLQNSINRPVEVVPVAQKPIDIPEIPSVRYYVLPPQSATPSVSAATAPLVSNCPSVANIPSNYLKSAEESYVPYIPPYNYVISVPEVKYSVSQQTNSVNSIPPTATILTIPSPIQSNYYNQVADSRQNAYINQNSGFCYTEPSQIPVVLNQPTAVTPSQPSILSSIPTSILQTSSVPSRYKVPPGYPVGNIAPTYIRQKSSSNLKSLLPLIFQLLKEKIASSDCRKDCPCECKNDNCDKKLNVAGGYSSQKDYGSCENDATLDALSEEIDSPECVKETNICKQDKNASFEESCEVLEEEGSDEEEIEDDEDD